MSAIESLGNFLSNVIELVVLVAGTVSLVLLTDYLLIRYYFEPVFGWVFSYSMLATLAMEGISFILIGIRFLSKRVEQLREGSKFDTSGIFPVFHRPPQVVYKARRTLGATLIGAGITLFIIGMFIIPIHYNL